MTTEIAVISFPTCAGLDILYNCTVCVFINPAVMSGSRDTDKYTN